MAKIKRVCEADVLHVPELVCVEDSKTALDASLCHLTVDRRWATDIGGSP